MEKMFLDVCLEKKKTGWRCKEEIRGERKIEESEKITQEARTSHLLSLSWIHESFFLSFSPLSLSLSLFFSLSPSLYPYLSLSPSLYPSFSLSFSPSLTPDWSLQSYILDGWLKVDRSITAGHSGLSITHSKVLAFPKYFPIRSNSLLVGSIQYTASSFQNSFDHKDGRLNDSINPWLKNTSFSQLNNDQYPSDFSHYFSNRMSAAHSWRVMIENWRRIEGQFR